MISSKLAMSAAAIAAAAISGQAAALAASAATTSSAHHASAASSVHQPSAPAAFTKAVLTADSARAYTVQHGDTLSGIGSRFGISWQALYSANKSVIGSNPNLILAGEVLALTGAASQQPVQPGGVFQPQAAQSGQSGPQSDQAQSDVQQPQQAQQPAAQPSSASSGSGAAGSFQQCVIQHESGGDAQVMNSSGHYGLYQFSQSTWNEAGGNPADFGHASAAEQNQVFQQAYAKWGTSPWAPYDGC